MKNLIKIDCDNFFISERLKFIDSSYVIYYNLSDQCYEVHSIEQYKNSYCFKVPYRELDERTLFFAKKTRSENRYKLIKEIEENNRLLYEKNIKNQVNLLKEAICL